MLAGDTREESMVRSTLLAAASLALLALVPGFVGAQEAVAAAEEPKQEKNFRFSIIGGPFYNSKVKLAVGAAPLLTFSTDRTDPELQRSTLVFPFSISTNGSFAVAAATRMFFPRDRMRGVGLLQMKTGPNLYFGRGYESGADPDNEEQFDGREFEIAWTQQWQTVEHLFVGGGFDIGYEEAKNFPPDGLIANESNSAEQFNVGLVGVTSYDSRDVAGNAYEGMLLEVEGKIFRRWLGGDNDYERLRFDYRGYKKISSTRNYAIAWQFLTERAWGDVPWQDLPALGSPREMRAYFLDRFRDEWRILGQFELRLHEIKGRFGLATWVAAGTVAPSLGKANIQETLAEFGIGLRFRLQPRQNARVDVAFGRGAIGLVLNVQEAF